jgi:hypothetical protein
LDWELLLKNPVRSNIKTWESLGLKSLYLLASLDQLTTSFSNSMSDQLLDFVSNEKEFRTNELVFRNYKLLFRTNEWSFRKNEIRKNE